MLSKEALNIFRDIQGFLQEELAKHVSGRA